MGKTSRTKGANGEREFVNRCRAEGIKCERVPLSGATDYAKCDVDVYHVRRDAPFCGEVKRRRNGLKTLYDWLDRDKADFVAFRQDHDDWLVVMPLSRFYEVFKL